MSSSQLAAGDLSDLVEASALGAEDLCRVLRRLDDTSQLTRGGEWTVRDTAVHVIGCLKLYAGFMGGDPGPVRQWDDLPLLNAAWFVMLDETDPKSLADMLAQSAARFNASFIHLSGEDVRPWHAVVESSTVAHIVTMMCNELLMHGWDIAAATGNSTMTDTAAVATVQRLSTMWPAFFRSDLGAGVRFGLEIDGLAPLVYAFGENSVRLELPPSGSEPDCVTSGSALEHMLWINGRVGIAEARLDLSGARPELADVFGFPR